MLNVGLNQGSRHMQFNATPLNMVLVSADATQAALIQRAHETAYSVKHYLTAQQCRDTEPEQSTALFIIDLSQHDESLFGLSQYLQLRKTCLGTICICKQGDLSTKLRALRLGADHVLTSPWEPDELSALIDNLEQRAWARSINADDNIVESNGLQLNTRFRVIRGHLSEQALSRSEFLLLMAFSQSVQQQLEIWEIYEVLQKNEAQLPKQALEAQIYRLRKKIRDCGAGKQVLKANRLQGYQLCCPVKID